MTDPFAERTSEKIENTSNRVKLTWETILNQIGDYHDWKFCGSTKPKLATIGRWNHRRERSWTSTSIFTRAMWGWICTTGVKEKNGRIKSNHQKHIPKNGVLLCWLLHYDMSDYNYKLHHCYRFYIRPKSVLLLDWGFSHSGCSYYVLPYERTTSLGSTQHFN